MTNGDIQGGRRLDYLAIWRDSKGTGKVMVEDPGCGCCGGDEEITLEELEDFVLNLKDTYELACVLLEEERKRIDGGTSNEGTASGIEDSSGLSNGIWVPQNGDH